MVWQVQSQEENDNNDNNENLQLEMVLRAWMCAHLIFPTAQWGKSMYNSCHSCCPQRLGEVLDVQKEQRHMNRGLSADSDKTSSHNTCYPMPYKERADSPTWLSLDHIQCWKLMGSAQPIVPLGVGTALGKEAHLQTTIGSFYVPS